MPAIIASASGVSCTRSLPNFSCSPAVARNTPPLAPTSCPITTTFASCCISQPCAIAMASIMVIFAKSMTAGFCAVFARGGALFLQMRRHGRKKMLEHRVGVGRLRRREVGTYLGLDPLGACAPQALFLLRIPDAGIDQKCANPEQRLEIPGLLDFAVATVAAGIIRGRMIAQAIGQRLDDAGALALARGVERLGDDFAHRE